MKHSFILLALCALCCSCTVDYGEQVSRNYAIDGSFSKLEVSHAFQVTMSDNVSDVVVNVGENAHDKVVVKVKNGKLHIGFKLGTVYSGHLAEAVIPSNVKISDINLSGASSFTGNLKGEDVRIVLSGASRCSADVEANAVKTLLSGASVARIKGDAQESMHLDISGASQLQAANLKTQSVNGYLSGASFADISCCGNLNINLSGASHLVYGPADKDCQVTERCQVSLDSTVDRR